MISKLFVDNDVLIKLAHWGLLDHLPASFSLDWSDVCALTSLRFRARRQDPKLFLEADAADVLADRLSRASDIRSGDISDIARLQGIVDLDAGEVELVAACLADPDALLISGDKRALFALANSCPSDVTKRLCGRVLCLEQLLTLIARQASSASVVRGLLAHRELDSTVRAVIGPNGCSESQFQEGMASYISHLRARTAVLLYAG